MYDGTLTGSERLRLVLSSGTELETEIISATIKALANGSTSELQLGATPAACLTGELSGVSLVEGTEISAWFGDIPAGVYQVTSAETQDGVLSFEAYDPMVYLCETAYVPADALTSGSTTTRAVVADICTQYGLTLAAAVPAVAISAVSSGYTVREMLGYMAALCGCNAWFDRYGQLVFGWYASAGLELGADDIYTGELSVKATDFVLGKITCTVTATETTTDTDDDGNTTVSTSTTTEELTAGDGVLGISMENPWMTQTILDDIWDAIGGMTYRPATVGFFGDVRIDPGDILTVSALDGMTYSVPVMSISHAYDGGVISTAAAYGDSDVEQEVSASGPVTAAMDRYAAQLALFETVYAQNLTAVTAKISKLTATVAEIDAAYITTATVETLLAEKAYITEADINTLLADYIKTAELSAEIAELGYLTADSATITNLSADVANITSILAGNIGTGNLQTVHLTADNTVIDNAVITDAMIADLSASKLTAGTIYTSQVTIQTAEGDTSSLFTGSLLQFSDDNTVRIQMGKDAEGEFNIYICNAAGGVIWDALGLTEAGLTGNGAIIKDAAVAADAAISGTKLDISSVAECLNEDGSLTVDYSKVQINDTTLSAWYATVNKQITETAASAITDTTTEYYLSTSATSLTGGAWSTTQPTWTDGTYLWVRTTYIYGDGSSDTAAAVCITGNTGAQGATGATGASGSDGADGVGISSIVEYYALSISSSSVTGTWSTTVPTMTTTNKYLWNYEVVNYTDGTNDTGSQKIIGVYGNTGATGATGAAGADGADGVGIASITNYYLRSSSASGVTTTTSGWSTSVVSTTTTYKYLWNYEVITYTDGTTYTSTPCIIGTHGATGATGATGAQGETGVGISGVTAYYATGSSATTQPSTPSTSAWSTSLPTVGNTEYLWVAYYVAYTDGTYSWTSAMCLTDDSTRERVSTLETELTTVQGQITAKVWQTDIDSSIEELSEVVSGELDSIKSDLTTLTDKYSTLTLTVDDITAEVGDLTTTVNGDDDTEGLVDKLASLTLTAETITATVSDNSTRVSALETQADEQASELDALSESMVTEISSLQTQIEQTAESITLSVEGSITTLTETAEGLQEELSQYATYFSFTDDGLAISESGSPFAVLLGTTQLSFTESDAVVAYISNTSMYITNAEITNTLRIGNFVWQSHGSGNMGLVYSPAEE